MLDSDDIDTVILVSNPRSVLGILVFIVIVVVLAIIVSGNEKECENMMCVTGHGMLVEGECLCVERPVSK